MSNTYIRWYDANNLHFNATKVDKQHQIYGWSIYGAEHLKRVSATCVVVRKRVPSIVNKNIYSRNKWICALASTILNTLFHPICALQRHAYKTVLNAMIAQWWQLMMTMKLNRWWCLIWLLFAFFFLLWVKFGKYLRKCSPFIQADFNTNNQLNIRIFYAQHTFHSCSKCKFERFYSIRIVDVYQL